MESEDFKEEYVKMKVKEMTKGLEKLSKVGEIELMLHMLHLCMVGNIVPVIKDSS